MKSAPDDPSRSGAGGVVVVDDLALCCLANQLLEGRRDLLRRSGGDVPLRRSVRLEVVLRPDVLTLRFPSVPPGLSDRETVPLDAYPAGSVHLVVLHALVGERGQTRGDISPEQLIAGDEVLRLVVVTLVGGRSIGVRSIQDLREDAVALVNPGAFESNLVLIELERCSARVSRHSHGEIPGHYVRRGQSGRPVHATEPVAGDRVELTEAECHEIVIIAVNTTR